MKRSIAAVLPLLLAACALVACPHRAEVVIAPVDADASPADRASCADACQSLERLWRAGGCRELGLLEQDGGMDKCLAVCANDQAQGVGAELDPVCVVRAQDLDAAAPCGVRCTR